MSAQKISTAAPLRNHDQLSVSTGSSRRGPGSLADIAKRTGICRSHLFRIMDGSRIPSLPVAWKLAGALKISLDELYSRLMRVKARRSSRTPPPTPNQRPEAPL
jgi:transcriptional regulator with XRE-family HTH domain